MRVYYGLTGRTSDRDIGGGYVQHAFISAASIWNGQRFMPYENRVPRHETLWLDSGGFSFFRKHGDYPYEAEGLVNLARRLGTTYVATMDYPCEPDVHRTGDLRTNRQRIEATIRNAQACLRVDDAPWVPVIQGYRVDEYLSCIEAYEGAGLIRPYMAIGTLCARRKVSDAWKIIKAVSRRLPGTRLHGFGVDLRFLKSPAIRSALWSVDTTAWTYTKRARGWNRPGAAFKRHPSTVEQLHANFEDYRRRVEAITAERTTLEGTT